MKLFAVDKKRRNMRLVLSPLAQHILKDVPPSAYSHLLLVDEMAALRIVIDLRVRTAPREDRVAEEWERASLPPLRANQTPVLRSCFSEGGEGLSGVIVAPCGAGKTIVALHYMRETRRRSVFVSTTLMLLEQCRRHLHDAGVSCVVLGKEPLPNWKGRWPSVILTTYSWLINTTKNETACLQKRRFLAATYGSVFFDEVHKVPASKFRGVPLLFRADHRVGMTATLVREDDGIPLLTSLIGPVLNPRADERDEDVRVRSTLVRVPMHPAFERELERANGQTKLLFSILNPYKIATLLQLLRKNGEKKTIVFCDRLAALEIVFDCVAASASECRLFGPVDGRSTCESRVHVLDEFRASEGGVLLASCVADHGVDVPDVERIVEMGANISRSTYCQRVGRAKRSTKEKKVVECVTIVTEGTHEAEVVHHRTRGSGATYEETEKAKFDMSGVDPGQILERALQQTAIREAKPPVTKKRKRYRMPTR